MIPFQLDWAAKSVGAERDPAWSSLRVQRVSTDTRDLHPGDLFFALRGPRFDAHGFLEEALQKGAVACVADRQFTDTHSPPQPCLIVDDTLKALGRLAGAYRLDVLPSSVVILAVTGSNGKTTTKCMIDHVLRGSFKGRPSPKSFNNAIGVPLTLLSAEADDRYVVVEIGASAPGEIAALASITLPYVAVITSIGEAHLEGFGDLHAVAREKTSLLKFVRPSGFGVVNVDRPEILPHLASAGRLRLITFGLDSSARLRVTRRRADLSGTTFELEGRYQVDLPMPGGHHATNAAAAFAVARWFGVSPEAIIERLRTFIPPDGRTHLLEIAGVTLVDDAYNANPSSVAAAIETLRTVKTGRRVFVLGDMLELGPNSQAAHRRVLQLARDAGIEVIVGVGPMSREALDLGSADATGALTRTCSDATEACELLDELLEPGDRVWIKGSRGIELDRVVRHLKARLARSMSAASSATEAIA